MRPEDACFVRTESCTRTHRETHAHTHLNCDQHIGAARKFGFTNDRNPTWRVLESTLHSLRISGQCRRWADPPEVKQCCPGMLVYPWKKAELQSAYHIQRTTIKAFAFQHERVEKEKCRGGKI
eukprot:3982106-Pleurochrysis_carterae.AAC.2